MHKHRIEINGTHIMCLTTKNSCKDIAYHSSVSINFAPLKHNTKFLAIKDHKLEVLNLPKLKSSSNILVAITISKKLRTTNALYLLLRKALPTVFDRKFIAKRNIELVLEADIAFIYQSACLILGREETQALGVENKYLKISKKEDSESEIISFDSEFTMSTFSST